MQNIEEKNVGKKALASCLAAAMVLGMSAPLSGVAFADDDNTANNNTATNNDNTNNTENKDANAKTFKVTFDGNGGTIDGSTSKTVESDENGEVSVPTLKAPSGKTFIGWAASKSATTVDVAADGDSYTATADTTLYAIYETRKEEGNASISSTVRSWGSTDVNNGTYIQMTVNWTTNQTSQSHVLLKLSD